MLEEDYLALKNNLGNKEIGTDQLHEQKVKELNSVSSQILKEIIIPEIEKEVNKGANFAQLRQVYHSLILAKWYKQNLKQSILNREYSDQRKIAGVDLQDKSAKEKIYQQYLEAFKRGVFDYIKEDYDASTQDVIARKYFSGGLALKVPLETRTGSLTPEELAKTDTVGKLNWIEGVYVQPRVSARYVNEYIGQQFDEENTTEGQAIDLGNGKSAKVYLIEGLLQATGQFGHIGLGGKERVGEEIVYSDDQPVIYLDADYANDPLLRADEQFKIKNWEDQKNILGREQGLGRPLNAQEMRQ